MIERTLKKELIEMMRLYPIVTLTGPRQSGKSTLLKMTFPDYQYVSLEDPDNRLFCTSDPRGFLETYSDKVIIDEAQRVPEIFSYIQSHTDNAGKEGMFVLAGSQNFLMMQSISQSLAGRTAVLKLLPFSREEMEAAGIMKKSVAEEIFFGSYPRIYDKNITPVKYFPYYIQTYVERDVMLIKNIGDQSKFVRFMKLCAGRIGQLLNMSSLANDCGISVSTAQSWLSILESSYIAYLLRPDHKNFSKRLVKTPKLYFYDTGLACSLLEIKSPAQLSTHFLQGGLFENLVVNCFVKHAYHHGEEPALSFWRDKTGNEVDLLHERDNKQFAYEIKSGATFSPDHFKGISRWAELSGVDISQRAVIYNGDKLLRTSNGNVIPWGQLHPE